MKTKLWKTEIRHFPLHAAALLSTQHVSALLSITPAAAIQQRQTVQTHKANNDFFLKFTGYVHINKEQTRDNGTWSVWFFLDYISAQWLTERSQSQKHALSSFTNRSSQFPVMLTSLFMNLQTCQPKMHQIYKQILHLRTMQKTISQSACNCFAPSTAF